MGLGTRRDLLQPVALATPDAESIVTSARPHHLRRGTEGGPKGGLLPVDEKSPLATARGAEARRGGACSFCNLCPRVVSIE